MDFRKQKEKLAKWTWRERNKKAQFYDQQSRKQFDEMIYGNQTISFQEFETKMDILKDFPCGEKLELEVPFEDLKPGELNRIKCERYNNCPECMGSGARSYDSITKCKNCSGSGFEKRKSLFDILFQTERDWCAKCEGKGFFINEYCNSCQGTGISLQKDIIEIELPKEIGPGMVMRIGRNGHAGPYQGLFGDLTLKFL